MSAQDAAAASAKRSRDQLYTVPDGVEPPAQLNSKRPYLQGAVSAAAPGTSAPGRQSAFQQLADAANAEAQRRQHHEAVAEAPSAALPEATYCYDYDDLQATNYYAGSHAGAMPMPAHAAAAGAGMAAYPQQFSQQYSQQYSAGHQYPAGAAAGGVTPETLTHPVTVGKASELPSLHLKVALRTWAKLRFPSIHREAGDEVLVVDLLPDYKCYMTYLRQAVDKGLKAITARKYAQELRLFMKQQRHLLDTDEVHYQAMLDELSITVADFRAKEKEKKRQQQQGHAARSAAAGGGGWQGHSSVKKRSGVVKRAMLASAEAEAAAAAAAALAGAASDDGAAAGCEINEAAWSAEQAAAAAALAAAARARPARSAAAAPVAAGRYAAAPSAAAPPPPAAVASAGAGPRVASQPQLDAATLAALPRGASPHAQQESQPQVSGSYSQQQLRQKHHSASALHHQQQMPQRTQQQVQRGQQQQQMSAPDSAAVRHHTPTPAEEYVGIVQGRRGPDSAAAAAAVAAAAAEADSAYHARSVHSRYGMATAPAGPSEHPDPDRRSASGQHAGGTVALQPSRFGGDSLSAVATLLAGTDPAAVAAAAAAVGLRPAHGAERVAAHSAPAVPAQHAGQQRPVSASAQAAAAQAAAAAEAAAQAASDAVTASNTDVHSIARTAVMDAVSASLSAASVYFKLLGRAPPPHVAAAGASAADTGLTALPEDHPASNTLQAAAASAAAAAMLGMQALGSFVSSGVGSQGAGAAAGLGVAPATVAGVTNPQQSATVVTDVSETATAAATGYDRGSRAAVAAPAADAAAATYRAPERSNAPAAPAGVKAATGAQTAAEAAAYVVTEALGQVQDSSDLLGLLSAVKNFLTSRQQQQAEPAVHEEAYSYGQHDGAAIPQQHQQQVPSQWSKQQQAHLPASAHCSYQQSWQQQQQEALRSTQAAATRAAAPVGASEARPNLDLSSVSIPALLQAAAASGVDMSQLAPLMATATQATGTQAPAPAPDTAAVYQQQQALAGAAHMQATAPAAADPGHTYGRVSAAAAASAGAVSQQGSARRTLQVAVPDDSSGTSSQQATHASPVAAATSAGASFAELLLAAAALEPTSKPRREVGGRESHAEHSRGQTSAAAAARGTQHGSSGHARQTGLAGGARALAPVKTGMGTSPVTDSSSGAQPAAAAAGQMAGDRSPVYRPPRLDLPSAAMGPASTVGGYKPEHSPGPAGAGSVVGSPMGGDWPTPRRKKAPARASRVSPVNASGTGRSPTDAASGQSSPGGAWAGVSDVSPRATAAGNAPQGAAAMMSAPAATEAAREAAAAAGTQRGQAPHRVGRTGFEHITGQQLQQCQQELLELQRLLGS